MDTWPLKERCSVIAKVKSSKHLGADCRYGGLMKSAILICEIKLLLNKLVYNDIKNEENVEPI